MDAAVLNLLATIALVGITTWYAISTSRILNEMKRQAETLREQSLLMQKSVKITALAALAANAYPAGDEPIPKLRAVLKELEELERKTHA